MLEAVSPQSRRVPLTLCGSQVCALPLLLFPVKLRECEGRLEGTEGMRPEPDAESHATLYQLFLSRPSRKHGGGGGDDSCFLGFCLDFSLPVGLVTLLAVDGTGSHSSEGMLTVSGPQRTSGPHLERETPIP